MHFDLIDPLRGFAAVTVLVYHAIAHFDWKDFPSGSFCFWFRWGWMGVDIFFVISGFVITLSALRMRRNFHGTQFFCTFLKRRFWRIAPLYYFTLFLFIMFYIRWEDLGWGNLLSHALFVHTWKFAYFGAINGSNWSVGTEMQFYIFIAMIIPLINYHNIVKVTTTLVLVAWLWRFGSYMVYGGDTDQVFVLFTKTVLLPGMLDEFGLGILLAVFVNSDHFTSLAVFNWFKASIVSVCILVAYTAAKVYGYFGVYWDNLYMVVFYRSLIGMIFALIILLLCTLHPRGLILWLIKPVIYLGTISYGIYLYHLPVMLKVKELSVDNSTKLFITLSVTMVMSSLSWHFFEKRFLYKR